MNVATRHAKQSRSTRNRQNGRINSFKAGIMKSGRGFEDSQGNHYAEGIVAQRRVPTGQFNEDGSPITTLLPSVTRVKVA